MVVLGGVEVVAGAGVVDHRVEAETTTEIRTITCDVGATSRGTRSETRLQPAPV